MPCTISGIFAVIAIVTMIYLTNATQSSNFIQQYQQQLPANLQSLYQEIVKERLHIYYMGYVLGFILSLIIIFYNKQVHPKEKMSLLTITSIVIGVSFITNYFYYILSPKTNWMLDNITTADQNKAWLIMYKHMQVYYHSGLVLGIIAVALISIAFRY